MVSIENREGPHGAGREKPDARDRGRTRRRGTRGDRALPAPLHPSGSAHAARANAPAVSAELHLGRARVLAARGDLAAAASELRGIVDATDRLAGSIQLSERRAGYRADKWVAYERLAVIERRRGRVPENFLQCEFWFWAPAGSAGISEAGCCRPAVM